MSAIDPTGARSSNATTAQASVEWPADRDVAATAAADGAGDRTLVTFRLGWQTYALPLECVERVLRMVAITTVPEAPAEVLGLVDLEGEVIPVVDLRRLLGLARQRLHVDDRLLVVRVAQRALAFAVDEATAVLTVGGHVVEAPPAAVARARPLAAVIRRSEGLVLVLDAARLLPEDDSWQVGIVPERSAPEGLTTAGDLGQLTRIRGIGRVYAARLASAGVTTLDDLAAAAAEEIVLLLGLPPARRAEAATWIEQARELAQPGDDTPDGTPSSDATDAGGPP